MDGAHPLGEPVVNSLRPKGFLSADIQRREAVQHDVQTLVRYWTAHVFIGRPTQIGFDLAAFGSSLQHGEQRPGIAVVFVEQYATPDRVPFAVENGADFLEAGFGAL